MRPPTHAVNRIGDEGARALAAALKDNTALTTLDLDGACPPAQTILRIGVRFPRYVACIHLRRFFEQR